MLSVNAQLAKPDVVRYIICFMSPSSLSLDDLLPYSLCWQWNAVLQYSSRAFSRKSTFNFLFWMLYMSFTLVFSISFVRRKLWNLDLCHALLPHLAESIRSKYNTWVPCFFSLDVAILTSYSCLSCVTSRRTSILISQVSFFVALFRRTVYTQLPEYLDLRIERWSILFHSLSSTAFYDWLIL